MGGMRAVLIALAAGLALADASIVTLGLPPLLVDLGTTVPEAAAVLGVYTLVVALGVVPGAWAVARFGPTRAGVAGASLAGVASLGCAVAQSLPPLFAGRALQAAGAAVLLPAAFAALDGGGAGRRRWIGLAVTGVAAGPALGGLLTQLFDWRAIFVAQIPVFAAAAVVWARVPARPRPERPARTMPWRPAAALALLSAALAGVLFLLVLLLVAGWGEDPLAAAIAVSVLPLSAAAAERLAHGRGGTGRAIGGAVLVGAGVLALAWLPGASPWWTVVPQLLAGTGMGLALPVLLGELLPEETVGEAARGLAIRHAGIALVLALLAPVVAADLADATDRARERGVAVVLDAPLDPVAKVQLAPALLGNIDERDPRAGLRRAVASQRGETGIDDLAARADEVLVAAVGEAFRTALVVCGLLGLLAGLVLVRRRPGVLVLAGAAALAVPVAYALLHRARAPDPVVIADPCRKRPLPRSGGLTGDVQDEALRALDRAACRFGSSREELVLALGSARDARRFEARHGVNPRSLGGAVQGLLP
jgi:Major Facilitator Superfamily